MARGLPGARAFLPPRLGEHEHLVAGLHAVERARPHPLGARDLDLDVADRALAEALRQLGHGLLGIEHHAVVGQGAARHALGQRAVLDAAGQDDVEALHLLAQGMDRGAQGVALVRAHGGDGIGEEHDAAAALAGPGERSVQIRGAERPARQYGVELGLAEAGGLALVDRGDRLVERGHGEGDIAVGLGQPGHDLAELRDRGGEARGARGAGVEQHHQALDALVRGAHARAHPRGHDLAVAQARDVGGHRDLEVAIGLVRALLHAHGLVRQGVALALADQRVHAQRVDRWQTAQGQAIGRADLGQVLRVRDDDVLGAARGDGEDARVELVAGLFLQQGRILAAVQEVLVGAARGLELDHLGLLPAGVEVHGQAADGSALGQRDGEAALDDAIERIREAQLELGEGQRAVDHGAGIERHQAQARAVRGGERQRRGLGEQRARGIAHGCRRDRGHGQARERGLLHGQRRDRDQAIGRGCDRQSGGLVTGLITGRRGAAIVRGRYARNEKGCERCRQPRQRT